MSALIHGGMTMIEQNLHKKEYTLDESRVGKGIEYIFEWFTSTMRLIGPFFFVALCLFILLVASCYFSVILPYYDFSLPTEILFDVVAIYLLIQIFFNYTMAVIVRPGCVQDIENSKYYSEVNPFETQDINLYKVFTNTKRNRIVASHSKYKEVVKMFNLNEESLRPQKKEENPLKFCNTCNEYKPIRSHHCGICRQCVFKMDHHCPWINNCVGQNNHRYFILFLTWILIGAMFVLVCSIPIYWNIKDAYFQNQRKKTEFNFVVILCFSGSIILFFFSLWNWFLILRGNTTIEFWIGGLKGSKNVNTVINDFNLGSWGDNFFIVFGTYNVFKAIFLPSIKKLPFSGLEWSKIVYEEARFGNIGEYNTISISEV